jgi:glycosyltransferase involved in cell wall biosynthesis
VSAARPPLVSVVIPVLNHHASLRRCLDALERQTYPRDRIEVIVVDNGSISPIGAHGSRFEQIVFLRHATPGSYAARNHGIENARGEVLAFTDADCTPADTWLERGVAALQSLGELGMVAGRIDLTYRDDSNRSAAELFESVFGFPQEQYVKWGFSATANLFTTRATMERVGRFDAAMFSGGDREWGNRVRALGLPQHYADEVCVRHPARRDIRELLRKARRVAGGVQRIAGSRGEGFSSIMRHAYAELLLLRRVRANIHHPGLRTPGRKLRFILVVWLVDLLQICERIRVHLGRTPRRT